MSDSTVFREQTIFLTYVNATALKGAAGEDRPESSGGSAGTSDDVVPFRSDRGARGC